MSFAITGIYASVLSLLMIFLGIRVSLLRGKTGISILSGDSKELAERVRVHANLAENLPMAIILMGIVEVQGAGLYVMHAIGLILLVSRLIHPFGIVYDNGNVVWRGVGMAGTAIAMLIPIVYILWHAIA
jgi:uncharacterized protein